MGPLNPKPEATHHRYFSSYGCRKSRTNRRRTNGKCRQKSAKVHKIVSKGATNQERARVWGASSNPHGGVSLAKLFLLFVVVLVVVLVLLVFLVVVVLLVAVPGHRGSSSAFGLLVAGVESANFGVRCKFRLGFVE